MHPLIERCVAGDQEAWGDLWNFIMDAAGHAIHRIVRRFGFDATEADDVIVEILTRLYLDDCRRLRSFNRSTDDELRAWLVTVACNYTRDWLRRERRRKQRESAALANSPTIDKSGPTTADVARWLDELKAIASSSDIDKLRRLAGLPDSHDQADTDTPNPKRGLSPRTIRRLHQQMKDMLRGGGGVTKSP